VLAQTLVIATSDGPPHMIAKNDSGIDLDIVKAILKEMGYSSEVVYVPLNRAKQLVMGGQIDLFVPAFYEQDSEKLFYSEAIIKYKPTIFSLAKRNIHLTDLKDLANHSVLSFQGATGYFGPIYTQATEKTYYRELADMSQFPSLLIQNRVDLVVIDYYIFYYYLKKNHPNIVPNTIQSQFLIEQVSAHAGFNNNQLRNHFNQALKAFIDEKKDQHIINQYIGLLP